MAQSHPNLDHSKAHMLSMLWFSYLAITGSIVSYPFIFGLLGPENDPTKNWHVDLIILATALTYFIAAYAIDWTIIRFLHATAGARHRLHRRISSHWAP